MKKRLTISTILTAGCLLCVAAMAFPQVSAKSHKPVAKRKRAQTASSSAKRESAATPAYAVRKGDTLYSIASAHSTTVAALRAANQLRTTRLRVGQKLHMPASQKAAGPAAKRPVSSQPVPQTQAFWSPPIASDESAGEDSLAGVPWGLGLAPMDSNAGTDTPAQPLRYRLASIGVGLLGVRYRWNGLSEKSGLDCSGLVKTLFDKFQIALPRSAREQFELGEKVDKDKLDVGDLVFFTSRGKTPSHVGIYLGNHQFLHAARKAKRVLISNLLSPWYTKRYLGARRFWDLWKDEPKPAETKNNN